MCVGVVAQEEGEVLELRLDGAAAVEVRLRARVDGRQVARRVFQTAVRALSTAPSLLVEQLVGLGAQPLELLGVGQHLPFGLERVVLARAQRRLLNLVALKRQQVEHAPASVARRAAACRARRAARVTRWWQRRDLVA